MFITIEGGHGCGKTTITGVIVERLIQFGRQVVSVADQAGTEFGREIRRINIEGDDFRLSPLTEALLIAAVRHQNVIEIIKPGLANGKAVISERFNDAFVAFQVFGRNLPMEFIVGLSSTIADGLEPDLTILLDVDPRVALARIPPTSRHRFEREPVEFHDRVREGYLFQAKQFARRCRVLDASKPIAWVAENAWREVARVIN
jgi:dTMP kinase